MFTGPDESTPVRDPVPERLTAVDLPHGVAAGDVTPRSAVVWTRSDGPATVHVEYSPDPTFSRSRCVNPVAVGEDTDCTATVRLADLAPGRTYFYRVWALRGDGASRLFAAPGDATTGRFRTPPSPDADESVSFTWGGDTYGQGRMPPYQSFRAMEMLDPDFFLYEGDTIYADCESPALPDGNPETVADYRAKYREMRERGTHLRSLLETTSVVSIWDDHEVGNDWAGTVEPRLPAARRAFTEYWPVDDHPSVTGEDARRLYRSFRWGAAAELFILDTRQYRDDNAMADGPEKTMLGDDQREWLKESLAGTDATFALVASTTSLASVSSGADERDSWASGGSETGFEHELRDIVDFVAENVESTVVWLTGDRHFARFLSYDLDDDGDPEMYEALASPIGAAPRDPSDYDPDETFSPTVHYEEGGKYEGGEFYNFGYAVANTDALELGFHDKFGEQRCAVRIEPDADDPLSVNRRHDGG
ncbi:MULTISPECIES: alkaline phosphatase D family protein [Halorussus]|uniref:alkaline phosphatase D family protein n=1 Tax=Halorussus TaxID=1070314 RepID=UPI00209EDCA1|nr:alkaline phosphatase D family protein [Halorussus vallis]USZ74470.1 alkaline phosphatase D family protein [Halorussus vallis]